MLINQFIPARAVLLFAKRILEANPAIYTFGRVEVNLRAARRAIVVIKEIRLRQEVAVPVVSANYAPIMNVLMICAIKMIYGETIAMGSGNICDCRLMFRYSR